jgi:hypothetical protein
MAMEVSGVLLNLMVDVAYHCGLVFYVKNTVSLAPVAIFALWITENSIFSYFCSVRRIPFSLTA